MVKKKTAHFARRLWFSDRALGTHEGGRCGDWASQLASGETAFGRGYEIETTRQQI